MNTSIKALIITVLLAVAGTVGYLAALHTPASPIEKPTYAGVSSPNIPFPYLQWGLGFGITHNDNSFPFTAATTTVCAISSGAGTSTLRSAGVTFTTSSTTATLVTLAKAATAFATSTSLGSAALAAGAQGTILASSTPIANSPLDPPQIFGPNTWFVVGMQGNPGTFSPVGRCWAEFDTYGL